MVNRLRLQSVSLFIFAAALALVSACARSNAAPQQDALADCPACPPMAEQAPEPEPEHPKLKNIILLIGDGMGPQQVGLLELYARYAGDERYPEGLSHLGQMIRDGATGMVITTPADGLVIESAAAATQMGSGEMSNYGSVGLGMDGKPVKSAIVHAKERGLSTGLVTDTRITHATPAAFAAHTDDRWDETDIAVQMLQTAPDLMFAGGWRYFLPRHVKRDKALVARLQDEYGLLPSGIRSVRKDNRNLLDEARDAGYQIVSDPAALDDADTLPILGLFAPNAMQNGLEWWKEQSSDSPSEPSLETMGMRAIELLSQNEDGFFLMIEGGQMDWAAHRNEPQRLLYELIRFDDTIGAVIEWAKDRDDTLVLVTADHDTGGFSIVYDKDGPPDAEIFNDLDEADNYVKWSTIHHTHTPVIAVAHGETEYTRAFAGLYHQTQFGQMLVNLIQNIADLGAPEAQPSLEADVMATDDALGEGRAEEQHAAP